MTDYIIFFQIKKYVGVQSWKAMHLPTLDIRVEQKGNRAMKWEIHVGFLLKPVYISGLSVLRRGQIRSLPA